MGSKFSKRQGETKPKIPKKEKKRNDKSNPRNYGSTQSLNIDHSVVSNSPYPNKGGNQYSQLEDTQSLSGYQHTIALTGHDRPVAQPRTNPPPTHPPPIPAEFQKENRNYAPFQSQTSKDLPDHEAGRPPPTSTKPPQLPKKQTPNQRKDVTDDDDDDDYLKEKKTKSVYHGFEKSKEKPDVQNVYDHPESSSKPKVRADRNYESNHESDISFRKGDILQLITDGEVDGWYYVRNLTSSNEGYVHKDWVTMITSVDVESQKCFFTKLDRDKAEEKLLEPDVKLGTYLLRPSGDGYALSLRCQNDLYEDEIRHYKVRVAERGICYIDADSISKPFSNITELIKYYTEKPGLRCKLKSPLPPDIPLNDLAVKFSDLKLGDVIGSGNFGSVYAGTLHKNQQVAVKSLKAGGSMTVEQFRMEAETMHKLRHPNLVSLLAICEAKSKIYIVTERMSKGALLDLLREDSGNTIKFVDLMHMAIQVIEGMCYLEKKTFVHRDLRAANVLVGDGNITKIADFGLTRLLDSYYGEEDYYRSKRGTVFPVKWTAPEAIRQQKFTVKSDVWSFGILLYEMVTYGDEPYAARTNPEALEWVVQGNRLKRPTERHCPVTLYNIMKNCWLTIPNDRPNFADIKDTLIEIKEKG